LRLDYVELFAITAVLRYAMAAHRVLHRWMPLFHFVRRLSSHETVATGLRLRFEIASPILCAEHIFSMRMFAKFPARAIATGWINAMLSSFRCA
jgi:hypothetical protein